MQKFHLELSAVDREYLQSLVKKSSLSVKVFQRAQGLLALDAGQTLQNVADKADVSYNTVAAWRDRYRQKGLLCLEDERRSGRPPWIDGEQRAKITALACSNPPEGYARWSLRVLADRAVELGIVEAISCQHTSNILKKTI